MRVLLLAEAKFPIPPEYFAGLVNGFVQWRSQYRDNMEAFFFYAGRNAGGGILNVADEAELNQIVSEWPFFPFSEVHIMPIVDGDVALKQMQGNIERMSSQMGG